jgi:hypothetical protein
MDSKRNFKKTLLASTCLTAISMGAAQAATVNESAYGNDFSNNLFTATALPSDTTQVVGSIPSVEGDFADFAQVTGLAPGSQVTVSLNGSAGASSIQVYTGLDLDGFSTTVYNSEGSETITIGSLGLLAFGLNTEGSPASYTINLESSQTNVPLAPTVALLGVGVAAMGLRRRKHGSKS